MHDWRKIVRERLASLRIDAAHLEDIITELAQHAEDRYEELVAGGTLPEAARHAVEAELDEAPRIEEAVSARHRERVSLPAGNTPSGNSIVDFIRDMQYGLRAMSKNPFFTFFAVLTLALGIGANTTVFTLVNTLLIHPLPMIDPSGLVGVFGTKIKGSKQANAHVPQSYPDFHDYEKQNEVFTGMAGFTPPMMLTLDQPAGPKRVFGEMVTAGYFDTLGLRPVVGRFFFPQENGKTGTAAVAVMSYSAWKGRFNGDPSVIGRTLVINKVPITVVGVAPEGFLGVTTMFGPDFWMPASVSHLVVDPGGTEPLTDRADTPLLAVARLKPGVTLAKAKANLQTIAGALRTEYPATNESRSIDVGTLSEVLLADMSGQISFGSGILMAIVGLVLAIACSNVANLLLARAVARRQEIAVRLALGASRGRLIRQSLTESLLLSLMSCAAGVAIGYAGCQLIWSQLPAEYSLNLLKPRLDLTVLAFSVAVGLATAILFGLVPALRSSRTDVVTGLKEDSPTAGSGGRAVSFTNILLVGQMAFSLVALITAALCLRSIERAYQIDPGFETKHLAIFMMTPGQSGYDRSRVQNFYRETRRRVEALPGIKSASWSSNLPFWNTPTRPVEMETDQSAKRSELPLAIAMTIDNGYFETMGVPVLKGRGFTQFDRLEALPVAVINQELAEKYWPGGNALGHRFLFAGEKQSRTVVGVARNANYGRLGESPQPCVYLPMEQNYSAGMTLFVRAEADPSSIAPAVQREIYNFDSNVPITDIRTGSKLIDQVLFAPRIGVMLLGVFGALALLLACVGLYGLVSHSVNLRHKELGLRVALGATEKQVLNLVIRDGMKFVLVGVGMGLTVSILVARGLSQMLFGVSALDPISVGGASAVLIAVALLACYLPARAAARLDPQIALRAK